MLGQGPGAAEARATTDGPRWLRVEVHGAGGAGAGGASADPSEPLRLDAGDTVTLHYAVPDADDIAVRVAPWQAAWRPADSRQRVVHLAQLAPGDYQVELRSAGLEAPPYRLVVASPAWATPAAYGVYAALAALAAVLYVRRQRRRRVRDRLTGYRLQRADERRDRFLTRTSYELRTPLLGMTALAESLLDRNRRTLARPVAFQLS
ncbi:MAG: hypothetical protein AAFX50_20190, partial [Acidobacteriota bacterium]